MMNSSSHPLSSPSSSSPPFSSLLLSSSNPSASRAPCSEKAKVSACPAAENAKPQTFLGVECGTYVKQSNSLSTSDHLSIGGTQGWPCGIEAQGGLGKPSESRSQTGQQLSDHPFPGPAPPGCNVQISFLFLKFTTSCIPVKPPIASHFLLSS